MKFFETSKYYSLKKSTYITLRWIAIIGQLISVYFVYFYLNFDKPIKFDENTSTEEITLKLNKILEKMVLKDPSQWILTHNRWK